MTIIPKGYKFSVASAGFRKRGKLDLALVVSDRPAQAAGVFTLNKFKASPVLVGEEIIAKAATVRAVLINSGQANACTGEEGVTNCRKTMRLVADKLGVKPAEILPSSTGVIGVHLKMDYWEQAVPGLVDNLGQAGIEEFASAIMTTDKYPKFTAKTVSLSGGDVVIAGVAKGAGMICPNMATMLSVVICDAALDAQAWRGMLKEAVDLTFNRVTVDGDTSTNDTLYGLANGASGVVVESAADYDILQKGLVGVLGQLAYLLVQDGEGATKVIHVCVNGAKTAVDAEKAARAVGHSPLVKTAIYGKDANWGRIVAALGRSGAEFAPEEVRVDMCGVELFKNGRPTSIDFDALLKEPFEKIDIRLDISLGSGPGSYTLMASDLTHEYININADYRS